MIIKQRKKLSGIIEIYVLFCWARENKQKDLSYKEYFNTKITGEIRRVGRIDGFFGFRYIEESIVSYIEELENKLIKKYSEYDNFKIENLPKFYFWRFYPDIDFSDDLLYSIFSILSILFFIISIPFQIILLPIFLFYYYKNLKQKKVLISKQEIKKNQLKAVYEETKISVKNEIHKYRDKHLIMYVTEYDSESNSIIELKDLSNRIELENKRVNDMYNIDFDKIDRNQKRLEEIFNKEHTILLFEYKKLNLEVVKHYREGQKKSFIVNTFLKTFHQINTNLQKYDNTDKTYIVIPILFCFTDYILHLYSSKREQKRDKLETYLMYEYYSVNKLYDFDKIKKIWINISNGKGSNGYWWLGKREHTEEENMNLIFQVLLFFGDILTNPGIIDNYFSQQQIIVPLETSLTINELLFQKISYIINDYANKIKEYEQNEPN